MARSGLQSVATLGFVGAALCSSMPAAWAAPPAEAGLAGQVAALQSQVANLAAQVSALSNAVTTLQGTAGTVQIWKNTRVAVPVQRNDATFISDWTLSTMASVSLPAGAYFIVAKTSVQDPLVSASTFYCDIASSARVVDFSQAYSVTDEPETMALQAVVTLSEADTVALRCGATGPASTPGSAESFESQIAAIRATLQ